MQIKKAYLTAHDPDCRNREGLVEGVVAFAAEQWQQQISSFFHATQLPIQGSRLDRCKKCLKNNAKNIFWKNYHYILPRYFGLVSSSVVRLLPCSSVWSYQWCRITYIYFNICTYIKIPQFLQLPFIASHTLIFTLAKS